MAQKYLRAPADPLKTLDPSAPKDLQHVVKAMLEAGYTPQQLTSFLSWDHTTIEDWAKGKSLPRSESYRKQLVEVMLAHVSKQANDKRNSTVENSANIGNTATIMNVGLDHKKIAPDVNDERARLAQYIAYKATAEELAKVARLLAPERQAAKRKVERLKKQRWRARKAEKGEASPLRNAPPNSRSKASPSP
jgi:hypothetical protein